MHATSGKKCNAMVPPCRNQINHTLDLGCITNMTVTTAQLQNPKHKTMDQTANAISGKTARACDGCVRRRARWYCAADDAFLCQSCDSSVHSANLLANRHDRVRLKTSSMRSPLAELDSELPTWHRGDRQRARTPRHGKGSRPKPMLLVPDVEAFNEFEEEEEQQRFLYEVPVLDSIVEFCAPLDFECVDGSTEEVKPAARQFDLTVDDGDVGAGGFDPTDVELAEFAADVENMLGHGLDDVDSFCMDGLGLLDGKEGQGQVKYEHLDEHNEDMNFLVSMEDIEMEMSRESLDFKLEGGGSHMTEAEVHNKQNASMGIGLKMNYDSVINAWSCHGGSPWADGVRPQLSADDCWSNIMGTWGAPIGDMQGASYGLGIGQVGNFDGGREARVSRYREKRRTRLFSKKIRYEVRKLNAEKRPRMKGRFVKRTSLPAAGSNGFPYA